VTFARLSSVVVPIAFILISGLLASIGYLARFEVLFCYGVVAFFGMWAWRRSLLSSLPAEYEQRVRESTGIVRVNVGRSLAMMLIITALVPLATVVVIYLLPGVSESWKSFAVCLLLVGLASKIPLGILITEWYLFHD